MYIWHIAMPKAALGFHKLKIRGLHTFNTNLCSTDKKDKRLGFTLAEVLITLVIIDVIAAMTVPSLIQNTNEEFCSALKKAISGANQALTLEYALEGLSDFEDNADLADSVSGTRMSVMNTDDANSWSSAGRNVECNDEAAFTTNDGIKFCVTSDFQGNQDEDSRTVTYNSYNTVPCGNSESVQLYIDVTGK